MKIDVNELSELIRQTQSSVRHENDLHERVLKLEQKQNELFDMLTDFRVNQIMGSKDDLDDSINSPR